MEGFTYNQLFAALQTWPEDDATEYNADIPRLIQLAELRLVVDLNLEIFDQFVSNILVTGNNRLVPKPVGLIVTRSLWLIIGTTRTPLIQRSRDFCESFAPDPTLLAVPRYYCEYSENFWYVVGTPNQSCSAQSSYIQRPDGLTPTNQNTWLGDNCGDLLFVCALMEAEQWIKADDRYNDMKTKYYTELLPARRAEMNSLIRSGQYSPVRPSAETVK